MLRALVASATAAAFLATGCTADRPWPAHPVALASRAATTQVSTIDVLPLDLSVWTEPGFETNLEQLRAGVEANVMNIAIEALARRNYAVNAMVDWNGDWSGGNAMSRDDLLATVSSLGHYGAAAEAHPGQLPTPFLPARLGTRTGSDATLYVGGWSYVAGPHDSGPSVGEVLLIGLLVVTVVAIIAVAASGSKSGKSHGKTPKTGGAHDGKFVPVGGGHTDRAPVVIGRSSAGHAGRLFSASRGNEHVGAAHLGLHVAADVVDAFGRAAIEAGAETADWAMDDSLPHDGADSVMYLEMTLVDNRTGLALWHAHQTFPADAKSAKDTARVARIMTSLLPTREVQTAAR